MCYSCVITTYLICNNMSIFDIFHFSFLLVLYIGIRCYLIMNVLLMYERFVFILAQS